MLPVPRVGAGGAPVHADLLAVQILARFDARLDAALDEVRRLEAAILAASTAWKEGEAARAALQARLASLGEEESRLEERLQTYTTRRDRTRALIDAGQATDYLVAQSQLAQCSEIVDTVEGQILEIMEQKEALEAAIAAATTEQAVLRAAWVEARARRDAERPTHEAEVDAVRPERDRAWTEVPTDLHASYDNLRRRKRPILVLLKDGACDACGQLAPPQAGIDTRMGRCLHRCRGCGGFILDELDDTAPEEEEEEAD